MPVLDCIVQTYEKFIDHEIQYELNDETLINLKLKRGSLPHLVGITKLVTNPVIVNYKNPNNQEVKATNIFEHLKREGFRYSVIEQDSEFTPHLRRRLEYFTEEHFEKLLFSQATFLFVFDPKKTKNEVAKYGSVFEKKEPGRLNKHIHLMVGENTDYGNSFYFPSTFKAEDERDPCLSKKPIYIKSITHLSEKRVVLNCYEINKQKSELKELKNIMNSIRSNQTKVESEKLQLRQLFENKFNEWIELYHDFNHELNAKHNIKLLNFIKSSNFLHLLDPTPVNVVLEEVEVTV